MSAYEHTSNQEIYQELKHFFTQPCSVKLTEKFLKIGFTKLLKKPNKYSYFLQIALNLTRMITPEEFDQLLVSFIETKEEVLANKLWTIFSHKRFLRVFSSELTVKSDCCVTYEEITVTKKYTKNLTVLDVKIASRLNTFDTKFDADGIVEKSYHFTCGCNEENPCIQSLQGILEIFAGQLSYCKAINIRQLVCQKHVTEFLIILQSYCSHITTIYVANQHQYNIFNFHIAEHVMGYELRIK